MEEQVRDSLKLHTGQKLSAFDKNHDAPPPNFASSSYVAFWYMSCHNANINGLYLWGKACYH
ncbi:unnamed protein product, partial [Coregonus sp. 'balchen']